MISSMLRAVFLTTLIVFANGCLPGERSFTIANNCNFPIWVGEWWQHSGSDNRPGGDGWKLDIAGSSDLCLPSSWSGRFWPRTGCNFDENGKCNTGGAECCDSGSCIDENGVFSEKCSEPGVPPVTLAEFTLIPFGQAPFVDYYDVSNVDGTSIPVEITPKANTFNERDGKDPYYCGKPGCTHSTCGNFSLEPCSWAVEGGDYEVQMQMVKPRTCSQSDDTCTCDDRTHTCGCSSKQDCQNGEVCGMKLIPGIGVVQACGTATGWFSADMICSIDSSLGAPLHCNRATEHGGLFRDLYGCTGPHSGSCYSNGASSACCGCPPWSVKGDCQNFNTQWGDVAQPTVTLLKSACPTAYSYAYDDKTSTFTCGGQSSENQVGYTVTFCPAGSPGSL